MTLCHLCHPRERKGQHIKAALTETHLAIPFIEGLLVLGTRQGIYLFEHRHHQHQREIAMHLSGDQSPCGQSA